MMNVPDEELFWVLTDITNSDLCEEAPIQTIMLQYEICCSWLQESKLIANLLTLERIFFLNMCNASTCLGGCLQLDPNTGGRIWL